MRLSKIIFSLLLFVSCSDVFGDEPIYGCTDKNACNFNENATENWIEACNYPYGTCDCDGLPIDDFCDCEENIDSDFDNTCDNVDICIGQFNQQGIYCNDIHIIEDIILNNFTFNNGINIDSIITNFIQNATIFNDTGYLTYLSLANQDLYQLPSSIINLDSLTKLYINDNNLSSLPSNFCSLNPTCEIFASDNNLCMDQSDFPCIDHWGEQDCD
tara:strand:+ start:2451 stop:3095 length:645 start_codon:yes stop_codon:yes gene_type:complete